MVKVGDEVEVKVLRVDAKDRKIGLSRKNLHDPNVPEDVEIPDMDRAGAGARSQEGQRQGKGTSWRRWPGGPAFQIAGRGGEEVVVSSFQFRHGQRTQSAIDPIVCQRGKQT